MIQVDWSPPSKQAVVRYRRLSWTIPLWYPVVAPPLFLQQRLGKR